MTRKIPDPRTNDSVALTWQVYDGLCREIGNGQLRPGDLLPRRRIAERYGVSYTVVIEALVRLEQTGLVEAETAQMARVRRVSLESIHSDYVLREAIESQSIRLACELATPQEISELSRLAERVDALAAESRRTGVIKGPRPHWDFHKRIAELSRCGVLVRELERIGMVRRFQRVWLMPTAQSDPPRAHSRLADVIEARDPDAADAEIRTHVRRGLENECLAYRLRMVKE